MNSFFKAGFLIFLVAIAQFPDKSSQQSSPQINVIKHQGRYDVGVRRCGGNATVSGEHIPGCSNSSPCPIAADGSTHDHIIDFYPSRNISHLGVRTRLTFENGTTTAGDVTVLNSKVQYGQSYTLFFQGTASPSFAGKRANNTFIVYDVSTGAIEFCYEREVVFFRNTNYV